MAGFFNRVGTASNNPLNKINSNYDGMLVNNSRAIGYIEGELRNKSGIGWDAFDYSLALADTTSRYRTKSLAFFDLERTTKREKLRDMATNSEIDFVIENISNDTIIYDDNNRFCHPSDIRKALRTKVGIKSLKEQSLKEEQVMDEYLETFDDIYSAWGFDNGVLAWNLFKQYLIDGEIAFEIIYDDLNKPKRIIGFKQLDPQTLVPIAKQDNKGGMYVEWTQRDTQNNGFRTFSDNQVVYLQYSSHHMTKRISFVESMVRSFNILRLVEYSKVMWHMMYGAIRLNTQVPVGSKTHDRAKEEMREFANLFKEDITFNQQTGEVLVDGSPKLHYYKNYITPVSKTGESIKIEPLEFKGPDLQDSQLLNYFLRKLKLDSKLPFSRWDYNEGGGSYLLGPDSVTREEINYGKFISRLRTSFAELVTKPIYLQMCLNNNALKNNTRLRNMIGVKFTDNQIFEKLKLGEINEKGAKTVAALYDIEDNKENSKFDLDLLLKTYMDVPEDFLQENEEYKSKKKAKLSGKPQEGQAQAQGTQAQGESQEESL